MLAQSAEGKHCKLALLHARYLKYLPFELFTYSTSNRYISKFPSRPVVTGAFGSLPPQIFSAPEIVLDISEDKYIA